MRFARLVLAVLFAVATVMAVPAAPAAHADAAGLGGDYVPLSKVAVVLDTRNGTGGTTGVRGAASTTTFPVRGVAGVPTTGVGSVLVRVAALGPTESTFLELWPDGKTRPVLTHLSVGAGEDLSNMAVVEVGDNGKIDVYNNSGKTNIVVEVQGYFKSSQGSTGGGFTPVPHSRLIDTRQGTGTTKAQIAAGASRTITITGSVIPAGAAAAAVNVATLGATAAGWLSVAPAGGSARPLMNYVTGTSHSFAALTLSSDGKVTIKNNGSAAVDVMIHAEGYYSATSTKGAGYRSVAKRLLNTRTAGAGLPLAAGATVDVQVGGTNGLPTRGIAGAQVGVVVTPGAAGHLTAWPLGEAEPSLTIMDFKANTWRAHGLIVKPGTDGKIRFRNGSTGTVHFIVDLEGWYADPIPSMPIAQNSRVSVLQMNPVTGATAGAVKYAYVDNAGRVVTGNQPYADNFSYVEWTVISGSEAFTGPPSLAELTDGRLQVAAQNTNSDIWADKQTAQGSASWESWQSFGGSMASPPTAIRLGNNVLTQFAVDADGKLWAYGQAGSQPSWRNLGAQKLVGQVSAVLVRGGARIFGVDANGAIKTVELYDDGTVSAWTSLGGTGLSEPAVVVRPGYQLQVFARAGAGTIVTKRQDSAGVWSADWQAIGTFQDGQPAAFTATGTPAAILDPALGRICVVVRGPDNLIYQLWETAAGSNAWGTWNPAGYEASVTDPTIAPYSTLGTQGFTIVFRNVNGTVVIYDRSLTGA